MDSIFGKISPPPGSEQFSGDPAGGLGSFLSTGIWLFIILCSLFMFAYMMWGAFDWIVSGGEKEKIVKAQNKITNAIIGFFVLFVVIIGFGVIAGNILGIVQNTSNGWRFIFP